MKDGRRMRIMVACVTFETVKITEPIKFYESTKVHLIHYVKDDSPENTVYKQFFDTVCDQIKQISKDTEIVEHIANVTDFSIMMKTVHSIICNERDSDENSDIFVNISAGSSEYIVAAAMTSMMFEGTIPFSVPTSEYLIDANQYFDKETNEPIGLSKTVKSPRPIPQFNIDVPDRKLVLGLRVLDSLNKKNTMPKNIDVIRSLKKNSLWIRGELSIENPNKSEAVYYIRDFVNHWLSKDWVYYDKYVKKYYLTEKGRSILKTFYCEDVIET